MEDSPEKLALATVAYTGIRRSELLGLQWEDIDFDKAIIHIRRSIKHSHNQPLLEDTTTKTKSGIRDVPLLKSLATILEPMRGKGYLLGGEKPYTAKQYIVLWEHIKKRVNVYDATAHVFRHTFLTTANSEGVDLKTLQTIAGHSDSHTTMQVYVHPQAEKIQEAGNRMDGLLHNLADKAASIHESAA